MDRRSALAEDRYEDYEAGVGHASSFVGRRRDTMEFDAANEPFELSRTRLRVAPPSESTRPLRGAPVIDEPWQHDVALDELASNDWDEEDPHVAAEWHARRWRRRAIRALGWMAIAAATLGVLGIARASNARGAIASWATLGNQTAAQGVQSALEKATVVTEP